jgi:hypothetical protein
MEGRMKHAITLAGFLGFLVSVLAGCAMNGVNLKDTGIARVEILPSDDPAVNIERADLYQDDGELVVKGSAYKLGPKYRSYRGHIDVAVIDPQGQPQGLSTAEYRRVPSRHRYTRFEVRFPVVAERGTLVRMVFHPENGTGAKHLAAVERLKAEKSSIHP